VTYFSLPVSNDVIAVCAFSCASEVVLSVIASVKSVVERFAKQSKLIVFRGIFLFIFCAKKELKCDPLGN
jgi:hypothetical protein